MDSSDRKWHMLIIIVTHMSYRAIFNILGRIWPWLSQLPDIISYSNTILKWTCQEPMLYCQNSDNCDKIGHIRAQIEFPTSKVLVSDIAWLNTVFSMSLFSLVQINLYCSVIQFWYWIYDAYGFKWPEMTYVCHNCDPYVI